MIVKTNSNNLDTCTQDDILNFKSTCAKNRCKNIYIYMRQLVLMFYVVYHHYRPMLDITTQIRRYSRREKERKKKENGSLKREREEKGGVEEGKRIWAS